ncbi:MAG: chemotaxis protein CheB [Thermomonas sp.]
MNKGKSRLAPADAASKSAAATGPTSKPAAPADSRSHASPPRLIVGIGASAGGLEAFKTFFSHMPVDSEMAFVLVQHLAPEHTSLLGELVGRSTTMPVVDAADGMPVEPSHVYVIPPNATLTIVDGVLQLSKPAPPRSHRFPIDTFFSSLAEDQGDCAVCVVLSGTGSDGARGLRAIKEHGGLTLAQAGFDHVPMAGMPASAAATGLVDEVLPVEKMPERLLAHYRHLLAGQDNKGPDGTRQDLAGHLRTITGLVLAEVGHDFGQYKEKTLVRRIQRRMQVLQIATVAEYIAHLRQEPREADNLFHELLISVTEFFRDPQAFEALQKEAIPKLLAGKGPADTIRVWVAACATGEEAYSIAILLREALEGQRAPPKVQIFATDIDERAMVAARAGRYQKPQPGLSEDRQERWFTQDGDDLCVIKPLREMIVFSPHRVAKDPPFSRLDLVSCRNLLIYMNPELQDRLVRTFQYALKPGGFLLLGPSEGLARNADLFHVVDKKNRLYSRRTDAIGAAPTLPPQRNDIAGIARAAPASIRTGGEDPIDRSARQALEKYAPAYVVTDRNHDIVRFAGNTGRYLGPASGAASLNVFSMLHQGLRAAARVAVQEAFNSGKTVVRAGLTVNIDGKPQTLRLIAEPLPDAQASSEEGTSRLCVLAFDDIDRRPTSANTSRASDDACADDDNERIRTLEQELSTTREQLHAAIDQLESLNEETKSANEEYQSVNEELQSSNEELETSKEEMQSINEELQTVNAEVHNKNEALRHANDDLHNLMDSTHIATLFLDGQLHVNSFTPPTTDLFHLRESDHGRPITEIASRLSYPDLAQDVKQVLRTLVVRERELENQETGKSYLLRMMPYRTVDNRIDGVVLTFVDSTERKLHELARGRLAAIIDSSKDAIIGHDLEGLIHSWNAGAERLLGYSAEQALGRSLSGLSRGDDGDQEMRTLLKTARDKGRPVETELDWQRKDGVAVPVALTCSPVKNAAGRVVAGSTIVRDATEPKRAAAHMELMLRELNHRVKNTLASVQAIALQTLSSAQTLADFKPAFMARLMALSNTHNLLAVDAWHGVGLREIVASELAPYEHDGHSRVDITGDDLQLEPKTALALAMAMHELATNASKYGALSVAAGRVAVDWDTRSAEDGTRLRLRWREYGGPPVDPPNRTGFGSRLITDGLTMELDGEATLAFKPDGVVCCIDIPLSTQEDAAWPPS